MNDEEKHSDLSVSVDLSAHPTVDSEEENGEENNNDGSFVPTSHIQLWKHLCNVFEGNKRHGNSSVAQLLLGVPSSNYESEESFQSTLVSQLHRLQKKEGYNTGNEDDIDDDNKTCTAIVDTRWNGSGLVCIAVVDTTSWNQNERRQSSMFMPLDYADVSRGYFFKRRPDAQHYQLFRMEQFPCV